MDDAELARLEHENMIAAYSTAAANAPDIFTWHQDGVSLFSSGLPLRLFNQIVLETDEAPESAVGEAVELMRVRRVPFVVSLRAGTDDGLRPLMTELGLTLMSEKPFMPGMALYPVSDDESATDDTGHRIAVVADEAGIEDHIRTMAAGFEMPEEIARSIMGRATADDPRTTVYVGYVNGDAVTTGLGLRTGRSIGVYNISTVPDARGRGYGAQMSRRVAADGVRAGCDVAVLQASDMGKPIYERLGYRTVVDYMGYIDPD